MSEKKLRRRKFLADLLFAGGGLTAAALIAKSQGGGPERVEPAPSQPLPAKPEDLPGLVAPPEPEPHIKGKVVAPDPHPEVRGQAVQPSKQVKEECEYQLDGDVEMPR